MARTPSGSIRRYLMGKTLLLLMQSRSVDTYVNVLAHCVYEENIERVVFVGNEAPPEQSGQLFDFIYKVYEFV